MKLKPNLQIYWIICFLILASSCTPIEKEEDKPGTTKLTSIEIGPTIEVASSTIPASGGTIKVSKPDSPVNGMEITIPANSFPSGQTFKVSYSEIKSHEFGQYFNPISPMITVSCDGGYSNDGMSVKIPIKLPAGHFAMGFLYDENTGKLEGMPIESLDNNFITIDYQKTAHSCKDNFRSFGAENTMTPTIIMVRIPSKIDEGTHPISLVFFQEREMVENNVINIRKKNANI